MAWQMKKSMKLITSATTNMLTEKTRTLAMSSRARLGVASKLTPISPLEYSLLIASTPRTMNGVALADGVCTTSCWDAFKRQPAITSTAAMARVTSVERSVFSFVHSERIVSRRPGGPSSGNPDFAIV